MAFLFFGEDVLLKIKMDRNFLVSVLIFGVSLAVSPSAFAWFFVIPGSVTRSISDAITGEEGFHCVGRAAKVGDVIQTNDRTRDCEVALRRIQQVLYQFESTDPCITGSRRRSGRRRR